MTTDEFLVLFEEKARVKQWFILKGKIRSCDGECPVCFMENQLYENGEVVNKDSLDGKVWEQLISGNVVTAADNDNYLSDEAKRIRNKLIEITQAQNIPN